MRWRLLDAHETHEIRSGLMMIMHVMVSILAVGWVCTEVSSIKVCVTVVEIVVIVELIHAVFVAVNVGVN
jgi:hypothetical protein